MAEFHTEALPPRIGRSVRATRGSTMNSSPEATNEVTPKRTTSGTDGCDPVATGPVCLHV